VGPSHDVAVVDLGTDVQGESSRGFCCDLVAGVVFDAADK
jgi:hypothetical protein